MQGQRVQSVDALRGLVMVIMALDHTREYFHAAAQQFQPENLARTTAAIFLTRWITHFCAPVFLFTAGIGAWYWLQRDHLTHGRTRAELSAISPDAVFGWSCSKSRLCGSPLRSTISPARFC
jgi:uncharacterized membrane protein